MRTSVLGVPADALSCKDMQRRLEQALAGSAARVVLSVNPEIVLAARRDVRLREALAKADTLLPDGTGLVWALRRSGHAQAERSSGADAMEQALAAAARNGLRVWIGIRRDGLTRLPDALAALRRRFPGLHVDGETLAIDATPRIADADVVLVNFGSPFQETWLMRHRGRFPRARLLMAVGGALEFVTGRLPRAPIMLRHLGLEWVWRLLLQPRRLWRIIRAVIIFPIMVLTSRGMLRSPSSSNTIRVRFAPSPTGFLHIGGLRTALYNYLFSRHHGGTFILRIEDTDRSRLVPGAAEQLIHTLHTMGLTPDEGPIIQSERLALYESHVALLVGKGAAYPCFCTSEELDAMRAEQTARKVAPMYDGRCRALPADERRSRLEQGIAHVIRLAVPRERAEVVFADVIRGEIRTPIASVDDAVLLKSDGWPTYHLASVVDDHDMRISHVIRGEEWISSTPKHVLLYEAFGWQPPAFAHLPLLLNSDKSKLSKRQGDVAVEDYLAKGYLPQALINFVALLGWNPTGDREIYSFKELAELFDVAKVNPSGAVVNFEKLDWLNAQYLRALPEEELVAMAAAELQKAGLIAQKGSRWLRSVIALEKDRLVRMPELPERVRFLFADPVAYEPALLIWKKSDRATAASVLDALTAWFTDYAGEWSAASIETALKTWITARKYQNGDVLWPLRVALTGQAASPGPFEISALLEKKDVIRRLTHARSIL